MTSTDTRREAYRRRDGRFGKQPNTAPDTRLGDLPARLRAGELGQYDPANDWTVVGAGELGVTALTDVARNLAHRILEFTGRVESLPAPPVEDVPITEIAGTLQNEFRADVLAYYLDTPDGQFDDEKSFYGLDGPLVVRGPGDRLWVVDGCHRWLAARERGDTTFRCQVFDL